MLGTEETRVTDANKPPAEDCAKILENEPSISVETRNLISAIQATRKGRPDLRVIGLVIGAAIAQTIKGHSELCTSVELGLIRQGKTPDKPTASCDSLRALVDQYQNTGQITPPSTPDAPREKASVLTADQSKMLITSLNAAYARESFKVLNIESHTSVLAIHWVPVRIAK